MYLQINKVALQIPSLLVPISPYEATSINKKQPQGSNEINNIKQLDSLI